MKIKVRGILFDFDGVIAESEQIWFGTALLTLKKMGITYDKSIKQKSTIGIISEHLFQKLILEENYNLPRIMRNYRKELKKAFNEQSPKIYPHLKKFIRSTNLKIGIVSNAHKHHILKILKKNNLHQYFRGNITSCTGDIPYKPFKNGYVIGYKKLGLKASEVLVIEDSDVGIEAALKAKVQKVLRHTNNDKNLPKNIKYRIPKLMGYKDFDKRF
ncbi:HAD family phosphatase [Alphaproteobacteria bacterium]|jgi:HAD superfamily hydrolase (TIGR01509 family)|nr:HAD family phosphatase [Alphaproteobacteria bacterium]MDB3974232.1 HAD family phosphatase [Alphaproteobacteria bacterium]|tara:strand:+ start:1149 stop:1793 length:645 start_codon:yes stop_codon:yes gene_type:complete